MATTRKVVWAEGILLTQQHFQQWDHYSYQQHYLLMNILKSHAWGVAQLIIDEDLVSNGLFLIKKCKIIFQDGQFIQYDSAIDLPLSYQLIQKSYQQIDIYLCLPLGNKVANVSGYHATDTASRWEADYQMISDENDHNRQQEILLARPRLILCSSDETREHYESIKIAEIVPAGIGSFQISDKYIPPLIKMTGSIVLYNACDRWIEFIGAKISVLKESYQLLQNKVAEHNQLAFIHMILLQSLNNTLCLLQNCQTAGTDPLQLYNALKMFISTLSVFDYQFDNTTIPNYDHAQLYNVFSKLIEVIKYLLDKAIPLPVAIIKLNRVHDTLYVAENIDSQFFNQHHFYLAVKLESPDKQWLEQFQSQIKLSAYSTIKLIAALAVTGVKTQYTQRLPHKLSVKAGFEYFYIEQNDEAWQKIKQERSLALFLPYALSNAAIELITIAEQ